MKNTILELAESVIHDSYVVSEDDAMDLYQSDAPEELFSAAEKIVQSCSTTAQLNIQFLQTEQLLLQIPLIHLLP